MLGSHPQEPQHWSRAKNLQGCVGQWLPYSWESKHQSVYDVYRAGKADVLIPVSLEGSPKQMFQSEGWLRFPSLSKEKSSPHYWCPYPAICTFWVVSDLSCSYHLQQEKILIYMHTHFVTFFSFIQKPLVLYSSHVYANATLLAYSFSDPLVFLCSFPTMW